MADNKINVGGRLHSVATGNVIAGANEILDDTQNKKQQDINAELIEAVGTVNSRIAAAVDVEKTRAEAAEEALDGRVDTLEDAVGTGGSIDSRISAAVAIETTRAQVAEADRYTKSETYTKEEVHNLITTPNQKYVSVTATAQTAAVTDVLPATGAADTIYRVGNWDGTQYNDSVFSEYAWNGSAYIKLSTKSQVGEVYDISANHADTKYADLAAALNGGVNIPQSLQRGGMSIKYVQSSDNKYVQYRLTTNEWSTNIKYWTIAEEGSYVENPEYIYVKTDSEGKILWAIKTDGSIYYGAGVPQQVIDYIEEKFADFSPDEYDDIVAFLNDLEKGDKTLQTLLNEKVDKEEGKSLIDAEYADGVSQIENPEFIKAELDAEQKLLGGIKKDGTYWFNKIKSPTLDNLQKEVNDAIEESQESLTEHYDYYNVSKHHTIRDVFNIYTANTGWQQVEYDSTVAMYDELDVYQIGEVCNYGGDTEHSYEAITSHRGVAPAIVTQEYVTRRKFTLDEAISLLPAEILTAFAAGQKICFVDTDDIIEEWEIQENGLWVRVNPYTIKDSEDRIEIKFDAKDKIIAYRKADGTWVECVGIEAPNLRDYVNKEEGKGLIDEDVSDSLSCVEDLEGRHEITTDSEGKIISYRKADGTLVENVGIKTPNLEVENLKHNIPITTESDTIYCERPKFGEIWFEGNLPTDMSDERKATNLIMTFRSSGINKFKCNCTLAIQGHGSAEYEKKGYTLEPYNAEGNGINIKFGDMIAIDSFHLKAYYTDNLHCRDMANFNIWRDIIKQLEYPFNKVNNIPFKLEEKYNKNIIDIADAKYAPDGFPVACYLNGDFLGLYTIKLKKSRQNYAMEKSIKNQILMEPNEYEAWLNEGFDYTKWEVKNPKMKKYDAGQPIPDATVLGSITRFFDWLEQVDASNPATYANYEDYINLPHWIVFKIFEELVVSVDVMGNNEVVCTWDGLHWSILPYDTDLSVGLYPWARGISDYQPYTILTGNKIAQLGFRTHGDIYLDFDIIFENEIKTMWTTLRKSGFIETNNIVNYYKKQCDSIPRDIYSADNKKWGNLWTNGNTSIEQLYDAITNRIAWLDTQWLLNN